MRFTAPAKALFLLFNIAAATRLPSVDHHSELSSRSRRHDASASSSPLDHGLLVSSRQYPGSPGSVDQGQIAACMACRKRCSNRYMIIHPTKCKKCIRCPKGRIANRTWKRCVRDDDPDGKKEKERQYQKKKREETAKSRKKRNYEKTKEHKIDERKDRKRGRVGRCLPLVPLAMGPEAAGLYADEFFHEDWLEEADSLLPLWDKDVRLEPELTWDDEDVLYEEEDYVNSWVDTGNSKVPDAKIRKRVPVAHTEVAIAHSTSDASMQYRGTTDVTAHPVVQKRFLHLIIMAIVRVATAAGTAAARAGGAILRVTGNTIKIAAKGSKPKKTPKEQFDGAKEIAKSQYWKQCLRRQKPTGP